MRKGLSRGALCLAGLILGRLPAHGAEDSAWIQLFNGKDLKDWDFKICHQALNVDPRHTFKVVDGNLFVDYSEYQNFDTEPFGHMGYKVRPFSYYLLRSEYQFLTGKQVAGGPGWAKENNGFMLHSQSIASMGKDQDFPISLEAQLLGPANGSGTMNLCTPGTNYHDMTGKLITDHCTNAVSNARPPAPAWTTVSALVLGDSLIKHMVGKDTVFKYTKPETGGGNVSGNTVPIVEHAPLKQGYIVIQAESAPVLFRKIEVLDLEGCMDQASPAYRSYFVKNDPSACTVLGVPSRPAAARFELGDVGGRLVVSGEGAYLDAVRLPDGSMARGFVPGRRAAVFTPERPGLYLVTVATPTGRTVRRVPWF